MACFLASVSGAAAAETWLGNGYEAIASMLGFNKSKRQHEILILRNDGRPFVLHKLPSSRAAVAARLRPPTRYVEILRGCIKGWCHVRAGSAVGWIQTTRVSARTVAARRPEYLPNNPEPNNPDRSDRPEQIEQRTAETQTVLVNIPLPPRKEQVALLQQPAPKAVPVPQPEPTRVEPKTAEWAKPEHAETKQVVLQQPAPKSTSVPFRKTTERNVTEAPVNSIVSTSLKLSDIAKKKYSLKRVEGITFLPVREDRLNDARVLGGIPFFANDVEALGLCVNDWCLVQRGEKLRGWIRQYHLSETHQENTPRLKLQNTQGQTAIALYEEPKPQSVVASYIKPEATGIVPVGSCDLDWCHVLYDNETGWIQSQYLARQ